MSPIYALACGFDGRPAQSSPSRGETPPEPAAGAAALRRLPRL